ncbi:MAG: SMP-30/gluconolactonase/LRE family protein [Bryobacteraceae bacterium]|jgi:D-xylonolactonase
MAQTIEVIADYQDQCGECPVWNPERSVLNWTDCTGLRFYEYDGVRHKILRSGFQVNGFRVHRNGGFVVVNNEGVWYWDGVGAPGLILAQAEGEACQLNDCIADSHGRLYSGSCFYDPQAEYPLGKLIRVDLDGTACILDDGIQLANGLGFSPDDRTLYFTDTAARTIYAYDYDPATGDVKNRRTFVKVPADQGLPDGMTVDSEGFVWSAQWYGSCVVRYDPDGSVERRIDTPAKQTSCVAFGGSELTDLFITSAAKSEPMPVMPPGYDAVNGCFGGPLYRVRLEIRGRAQAQARISMPGR